MRPRLWSAVGHFFAAWLTFFAVFGSGTNPFTCKLNSTWTCNGGTSSFLLCMASVLALTRRVSYYRHGIHLRRSSLTRFQRLFSKRLVQQGLGPGSSYCLPRVFPCCCGRARQGFPVVLEAYPVSLWQWGRRQYPGFADIPSPCFTFLLRKSLRTAARFNFTFHSAAPACLAPIGRSSIFSHLSNSCAQTRTGGRVLPSLETWCQQFLAEGLDPTIQTAYGSGQKRIVDSCWGNRKVPFTPRVPWTNWPRASFLPTWLHRSRPPRSRYILLIRWWSVSDYNVCCGESSPVLVLLGNFLVNF